MLDTDGHPDGLAVVALELLGAIEIEARVELDRVTRGDAVCSGDDDGVREIADDTVVFPLCEVDGDARADALGEGELLGHADTDALAVPPTGELVELQLALPDADATADVSALAVAATDDDALP